MRRLGSGAEVQSSRRLPRRHARRLPSLSCQGCCEGRAEMKGGGRRSRLGIADERRCSQECCGRAGWPGIRSLRLRAASCCLHILPCSDYLTSAALQRLPHVTCLLVTTCGSAPFAQASPLSLLPPTVLGPSDALLSSHRHLHHFCPSCAATGCTAGGEAADPPAGTWPRSWSMPLAAPHPPRHRSQPPVPLLPPLPGGETGGGMQREGREWERGF